MDNSVAMECENRQSDPEPCCLLLPVGIVKKNPGADSSAR